MRAIGAEIAAIGRRPTVTGENFAREKKKLGAWEVVGNVAENGLVAAKSPATQRSPGCWRSQPQ